MKNFSVPLKYGIFIAVGLIAYFLILALLDLVKYPAFSMFNIVITGVGMFLAIKKYRRQKGAKFKYQKGFVAGFTTGFIATVIFTGFFAIYSSELNPDFSHQLITMWDSDWFVNLGLLVFTVALMGFATSFVLALSFMQLLKDSWNTGKRKKHSH